MKKILLSITAATLLLSSCTTLNKSMREPESHVQFHKSDFTFSEQVSGQATSTRIFGIDFERLFQKNTGTADGGGAGVTLASIPVIGNVVEDKTANYALYDMMEKFLVL